MSGLQKREEGRDVFWWDHQLIEMPTHHHFQPAWWAQQGRVIGSSTGRNMAWFVRGEQAEMVLRHYYRGGLLGKLCSDQFMLEAVERSRAMREFTLLQWMVDEGLPVPRPCAARYTRKGLSYRADLLITKIPNSRDLFHVLLDDDPLTEEVWQAIGQAVRQMHKKGIFHSDLNCHNILLDDQQKVWLIDFDKCERREPGDWQRSNCERLLRSLRKEREKHSQFGWHESDWSAFTAGYRGDL